MTEKETAMESNMVQITLDEYKKLMTDSAILSFIINRCLMNKDSIYGIERNEAEVIAKTTGRLINS